ncbi:GNAT family N-acetyltransferase [Rhizobium leguminosarum]|uniref:GNAT family N-acetyltransferase n=1 Tax=Rhizobium leguminosarum TaxID=384 RepID=UPI003CFBDC38
MKSPTRLSRAFQAAIGGVAIHHQFQGRGFGRALMAGLDHIAVRPGARRLTVHSARDGVGFYEALGWTLIDAARDYPLLMKELRSDA